MISKTSSLLCLLMALATGALLGFFTVILLPFLFFFWLTFWLPHELDAHLSAAMPSPSVRCDGGMEGKAEQAFEKSAMKDGPLPKQFEDWWNKKNEEMS